MNDAPLVEIHGLRKDYSGKLVLDGIDLTVGRGHIVGYLGANGAGKSTTIKILLGLVRDYTGDVRVAGFDPRREAIEIKKRVGYVPENAILYE
jgi:ABC-2 type transport system ATP-binding protein